MINLKNKYCLVTGCNGYIGRSICKKLKYFGAKVIETDIKKNSSSSSKNDFFISADLENIKDVNELYEKVKKKFKKLDILINNAGYVAKDETNKNIFYNKKYIDINLSSTINLTEKFLSLLNKSKSATIVNIASIYGFLAYDKNLYKGTNMITPMAYGISKSGLIHFTKLLAAKLAPKVRVNSISPGGVFRNQPKKFIKKYLKKTPLKRMATEDEVANSVIFLSSNFSNYITGHNLIIDGGYSLT